MISPLLSPRARRAAAAFALALPLAAGAAPTLAADLPGFRWLAGLDLATSTIDAPDAEGGRFLDQTSYGWGLQAGRLLTPALLLRLDATVADHATDEPAVDARVEGVALDAAWLFRHGHGFRPYLCAGAGGYRARSRGADPGWEASGPGVTFGGGWYLGVGGRMLLHAALRVQSVGWDEAATPLHSGWTSNVLLGLALAI